MKPESNDIHRLVMKKVVLFSRYAAVTGQLADALKADNLPRVSKLTLQRQRLREDIGQVDRILADAPGFRETDGAAGEAMGRSLRQLKTVVGQVESMDREIVDMAQSRRDTLKQSLLALQSGRKAVSGYRRSGGGSRFVDRTG